jgi:hypothetical protein
MGFGLWDESKRKRVKKSVKREVYKRAGGKCENCKKKLPFTGGAGSYHHTRVPKISPTAKTVQLLCRNCHAELGHKRKIVKHYGLFETWTEQKLVRKRVGARVKKPKTKRVAIRDWTGEITGYKKVKVKVKPKKKTKKIRRRKKDDFWYIRW